MESGYRQGYTQGVADGLSKVNVQYTYHEHIGDKTNGGGCYTAPNMVNLYCTGYIRDEFDENGGTHIGTCNKCGSTQFTTGGKTCNRLLGTTQEGYTIGCGKTEETIESATIIY